MRPELLRAAHWHAARFGLGEGAVGLQHAFGRPALEDAGECDEAAALAAGALRRGTVARRQREAYARTGRLESIVDAVVADTARGVG